MLKFNGREQAENSQRYDITLFFEGGPNNGMVIYKADYEDLTYALSTYYSDNFYIFNKFNCDMKDNEETIVNLSQIQFIRVRKEQK
jgi:hypothetical protein